MPLLLSAVRSRSCTVSLRWTRPTSTDEQAPHIRSVREDSTKWSFGQCIRGPWRDIWPDDCLSPIYAQRLNTKRTADSLCRGSSVVPDGMMLAGKGVSNGSDDHNAATESVIGRLYSRFRPSSNWNQFTILSNLNPMKPHANESSLNMI